MPAASVFATPGTSADRPWNVTVAVGARAELADRSRSVVFSTNGSVGARSMLTCQSQNIGRQGWPHIVTPSGCAHTPSDSDSRSRPSVAFWRSAEDATGEARYVARRALSAE